MRKEWSSSKHARCTFSMYVATTNSTETSDTTCISRTGIILFLTLDHRVHGKLPARPNFPIIDFLDLQIELAALRQSPSFAQRAEMLCTWFLMMQQLESEALAMSLARRAAADGPDADDAKERLPLTTAFSMRAKGLR